MALSQGREPVGPKQGPCRCEKLERAFAYIEASVSLVVHASVLYAPKEKPGMQIVVTDILPVTAYRSFP